MRNVTEEHAEQNFNLYEVLGAIVAEATRAETALMHLVSTMLGGDATRGWYAFRGERSSSLLGIGRRLNERWESPFAGEVADLFKATQKYMDQRDSVVHSEWLWFADRLEEPEATRSRRSGTTVRVWKAEELRRLHQDLRNLTWDLRNVSLTAGWLAATGEMPMNDFGRRDGDIGPDGRIRFKPWDLPGLPASMTFPQLPR